jgi:hypothetical protein
MILSCRTSANSTSSRRGGPGSSTLGAQTDAAGAALVLGMLGLLATYALLPVRLLASTVAALVILGIAIAMGRQRKPEGRQKRVKRRSLVRVTETAIELGASTIPRSSIARAHYQLGCGRPAVRCVDRSGKRIFEAEVDDEASARELLRVLGWDVEQRRMTFEVESMSTANGRLRARGLGMLVGLPALAIVLGAVGGLPMIFIAIVAATIALLLAVPAAASAWLEIGSDGLTLQWLDTRRFISWNDVNAIEVDDKAIALKLGDGTRVPIPSPPLRRGRDEDRATRDALVARIEQARAAYTERTSAQELVDRVRQGDRPIGAWKESLERLAVTDYRMAGPRDEDLWRVVEDAAAPEDARAAAAVVLSKHEEARPRIRSAAEAVASPQLRVALETAADDGEVDEVLETIAARASLRRRAS